MQEPLIDKVKAQLLSFIIFNSGSATANGSGTGTGTGNGTGTSSNSFAGMYNMAVSFIFLTVFEKCSAIIPIIMNRVNLYIAKKTKIDKLIALTETKVEKTSSVLLDLSLENPCVTGSAILDYITSRNNIIRVKYTNKNYLLNNREPVLIDTDIYCKLLDETVEEVRCNSQSIEIYSFVFNVTELRKFIDQITLSYTYKVQNKLGDKIFYFNEIQIPPFLDMNGNIDASKSLPNAIFTMKQFQTNRKFCNVIGDQSRAIIKRVEFFRDNKKWYDAKGIPYTLGLLLSGPPGAGKTSTIKCVANEMKRHIINVRLTEFTSTTQIDNLFFNEIINVNQNGRTEQLIIPIDKRIYVFEDVDCQSKLFLDRELGLLSEDEKKLMRIEARKKEVIEEELKKIESKMNKKNTGFDSQYNSNSNNSNSNNNTRVNTGLSLSYILNILDGILETPGRIIIMTSNYPDILDRALIRPGRIDLISKFTNCSHDMVVELIEKFHDKKITDKDRALVNELQEYTMSPAVASKYLFENFDSYVNAIQCMKEFQIENQEREIQKEKERQIQKQIDAEKQKEKELREKKLGERIYCN